MFVDVRTDQVDTASTQYTLWKFVTSVNMYPLFKVALNQLVEAIQLRCQHMFALT